MNDNGNEVEIKIEYFESFETDPLSQCEEIKQNDSCLINNRIVLDNQEDVSKSPWPKKNFIGPWKSPNYENNELHQNKDIAEPEIIANWHKQVDVSGKYVCKFCDLSYLTIQSLRHHVRIKHTDNYNAIKNTPMTSKRLNKSKCHICKKTFENVNDLLQHSHMHGLNNSQNSCLLCLVTFQDRTDLLHHMTNKHESLKKLHICAICGYSTPKLFNYKKHMNIHTGENKRKCTYCSYTTYSQPNLKIHEQTHSNEKPYVCGLEGCEYQCKTVSALRSHLLMHNKENYTLYCDKCSYSTVYRINLKKHIETHWRQKVCDQNRIDDEGISVP